MSSPAGATALDQVNDSARPGGNDSSPGRKDSSRPGAGFSAFDLGSAARASAPIKVENPEGRESDEEDSEDEDREAGNREDDDSEDKDRELEDAELDDSEPGDPENGARSHHGSAALSYHDSCSSAACMGQEYRGRRVEA
jgi:hypothetical protein